MFRWRPAQSPLWLPVGLLGIKRPLLQGYFAEETTLSLRDHSFAEETTLLLKRPSNLDSPSADLSLATLYASLVHFQRAFSPCAFGCFFRRAMWPRS